MNLSNRRLWLLGAIAITAIMIVTLLFAPANNKLNSGSTYNRAPDGYGAWYAFMSKRGIEMQRWQKTFADFAKNPEAKSSSTLLRIYSSSNPEAVSDTEENWVRQGNILVNLGVRASVSAAPFSTMHSASAGEIKIDTGRREAKYKKSVLGDDFGAIVWQKKLGKGIVYFAVAPHLAANAYQDFPGNYEFLARLVTRSEGEVPGIEGTEQALTLKLIQNSVDRQTQNQNKIRNKVWVDEYIHGYKDPEIIQREYGENLFTYLAKTPLLPILIQGIIILIVAIFAGWNRFGQPVTLSAPQVDNSEAYIQALAGVLEKANSTDFAVEIIGKAEQLQLQKSLLLGQASLETETLINAWAEQTGRKAAELEELLRSPSQKRRRLSDPDLLARLRKWEQIRQHLPSNRKE
ncbi:MAG: DUF4350 domain-containing protein [Microcoleus sp. CSU_2_2]|nr:DUF4350 domain-containing protein [Microcoleus sp. CSU_2_2]